MHYGGQFKYTTEKVYVSGTVSYIDYCHSDEMSLIELELIGSELGCLQTPVYMYKVNGFDLEVGLVEIKTYIDALNLNKFVDEHGIVDMYMKLTSTEAIEVETNIEEVEGAESEEGDESEEGSTSENSDSSFGASDPDFNESFNVESDEDDNMFYENVDHEMEWVGGEIYRENEKRKMVREERVNEGNDKGKMVQIRDSSETDYPQSNDLRSIIDDSSDEEISSREKFPEFNVEADMESHVFKLGMVFNSANEFRQAMRAYAIRNGKKNQIY